MLLSALRCTVARICIKILHVVKMLRVRVKQFSGATALLQNTGLTSRDRTPTLPATRNPQFVTRNLQLATRAQPTKVRPAGSRVVYRLGGRVP
jgi:hypothetical protein